jgi:hypothetical protein
MRMWLVVTDSGIEVAVEGFEHYSDSGRGRDCTERVGWGLRTWMVPSVATLRWLIYEATAEETPARIYHLPPLNSIVLEKEQVERFHIVARSYEIKTQNEGVV